MIVIALGAELVETAVRELMPESFAAPEQEITQRDLFRTQPTVAAH